MATKNYMINDKWLDLDKQNIVELQSVDGVLDTLKVNGSEIVTPSGKITITENGTDIDIAQYALADVNVESSSDFSTAVLTLDNTTGSGTLYFDVMPSLGDNDWIYETDVEAGKSVTLTIPLYKSKSMILYPIDNYDIIGNVVYNDDDGFYYATGDFTVKSV